MSIHDKIRDQVGLAKFYAKDGAFHTAAKILHELADEVEAHACWADRAVTALLTDLEQREG
ncbi:hypothetical protein ASD64_07225 [Mesorhizobium sp. Root157]|uniref:hypothetical protein n=1 Tax=Mesorhizobium sp. Root157 TaxID=1736477 RepID=UPI0006F37A27|nr:hypothetical protein [Mesorhizobium sp. Root157]KQZ87222.1 hypothetical protein ASD64_07225 [Mesorhizobium sp. Root157]